MNNFLRRHPLITIFSTALVLRGGFAFFCCFSPFRYFHTVPGLDMETLLRFGEWGTPGNSFFFTPHRLQVFLLWKLNGTTHVLFWHFLWQSLLGAAGGVMLADIMLKISGKKNWALLAGLLWILNPVELMYEFTTLQDSLVNFGIVLSVWSLLAARKHHFSSLYALSAGAAAGVAGSGRPVATGLTLLLILWCVYYLKRRNLPLQRAAAFAGGVLGVWLIFSSVNYFKVGTFNCFFNPVPYALSVNTAAAGAGEKSVSSSFSLPPLAAAAVKMALRTPQLWNPVEVPENLNIYFLKKKIPFFRLPFEFIMMFAAAGFLIMLATGRWKKKEGVILLPVFALAFFLCIREPIGRYRLLMLPWFVLLTVWITAYSGKDKRVLLCTLLIAGAMLIGSFFQIRPIRAADYAAWGWALEKEAQKITPEVLDHFQRAFQLRPDANNAVSLITRAMKNEDRALAMSSAAHWMKTSGNAPLACYYAGLAAFPDRREMKKFLDMVDPASLPSLLRFRFFFMQGNIAFKAGHTESAAGYYKKALSLSEGTPAQRKYAEKIIKISEKKND